MPSHAQTAARAWVSGHGTDASACGAPTNPCRSFQYVHDNIVKAGGEIDVLDPAGYGAINISKAISIVNDGVGTAGVQQNASGGTAITINAGAADEITLRGLNIDGLGIAANGIVFNSGGSLSVINCVIRHFIGVANGIGNGILMQPASGMVSALISDTILSDNGSTGFFYYTTSGNAALTAILDKVTATNDFAGVIAYPNGTAQVSISNSVLGKNSYGAQCATTNSGNVKMSVDLSQLNDNGTE